MVETSQDKPDLTKGIPEGDLADGAMLVGQVGQEQVLLARARTLVLLATRGPLPCSFSR